MTDNNNDYNNNVSNQFTNSNNNLDNVRQKGRWSTGKMVIGIVSIVLFLIISLQSCAVGIGNTLTSSGEISGSFGLLVGLFMCIAGIVGISTRNSTKTSGSIAACVLYWIAAFLAYVGAGSYADLKIWGFISLAFGFVFLMSTMETTKSKVISTIATIVFLIILVAIGSSENDASSSSASDDPESNIVTNENEDDLDNNHSETDSDNAITDDGDIDSRDDSDINNDVGSVENTAEVASNSELESIEEQVLLDQEGIKITALEMVDDSIWGKGIKVLIDNNSDKSVVVGLDALIVNNYMISDLFASHIAPGKSAYETIYISSSALEQAGINNIGQVELYFNIYDSDSYEDIFEADVVTIHTSAYDNMDVDISVEGSELVNQDGIRIIGKYVDEDSFWGSAILLYIENSSDKDISISCDDMSINGFMVSSFFSSSVYSGKMSIDEITIFESDLEDNNIDKIEDVEFKFQIYDSSTYDTILETDVISFSVQ